MERPTCIIIGAVIILAAVIVGYSVITTSQEKTTFDNLVDLHSQDTTTPWNSPQILKIYHDTRPDRQIKVPTSDP